MIDKDQLSAMLSEHQLYHSPFQIERFILDEASGGSQYGYYKQCLRELRERVRNVRVGIVNLRKAELELENIPYDLLGQCDRSLKAIEIEGAEETLREQWRELNLFYQHARYSRVGLGDLNDPEVRDRLDRDMWESAVRRRMYIERRALGGIKDSTLKMLLHLQPETQYQLEIEMKAGMPDFPRYDAPEIDVKVPPLPGMDKLQEIAQCYDPSRPQIA